MTNKTISTIEYLFISGIILSCSFLICSCNSTPSYIKAEFTSDSSIIQLDLKTNGTYKFIKIFPVENKYSIEGRYQVVNGFSKIENNKFSSEILVLDKGNPFGLDISNKMTISKTIFQLNDNPVEEIFYLNQLNSNNEFRSDDKIKFKISYSNKKLESGKRIFD